MNEIEAANALVKVAQTRVAELQDAERMLREALPQAQQALEAAKARLRRLKTAGARADARAAEIAALQSRIAEAKNTEVRHV
ncbi:hypothetical protein LOY34_14640 [Pseudomonas sp. B21-009]|uniref:hypothetical protein n=1 Tax=Pseudomonas sp. B21-009 TaxID=2895470 RepID=UPI00215F9A7C|nr:hypothetical protein [Pseudomonas sp. B21-009]UVM64588.1 hypothetical protein LOY34_14640 [Pseudomonas sp. B21-009]